MEFLITFILIGLAVYFAPYVFAFIMLVIGAIVALGALIVGLVSKVIGR